MKKLIQTLVVLVALATCIPCVGYGILYHANPVESLLIVLSFNDTKWAPGYSYKAFRQVRPGMTQQQCTRLLGPSLAQTSWKNATLWWYTTGRDGRVQSSSSGWVHQRAVVFGPDTRVKETMCSFCFD
ncbi:MAG: outer membrane protein assembly factor BamE [Kiritimatiellaeota bacterium]|nr:outer membrane protein assembly factor BamE [Kiritimatiellota bacterium]